MPGSKLINLSLRGFQFFWTLLIMALVGNTISLALGGNPSIINYVMFVAVFSMLSLFYLIPATVSEGLAGHAMIPLALDVLNTLFFFCGAVAMAAYLHVHSCGDADYVNSNVITSGSRDNTKRCHESQANTAFLWFGFIAYVGSLVFSVMGAGSSGGVNMRGGVGGIRRGPPAMSQV